MAPTVRQGVLNAEGKRFGIVVSRFNELISKQLLDGALDCLYRHGAREEDVEIAWVPGSFEIPLAAKAMARAGKHDAVICLGAVIRGDTPHHQYIASEVTKGIAQVALDTLVPISYGVITPDTLEQALERAGTKAGNKGWQAALSAIEMANLMAEIGPRA